MSAYALSMGTAVKYVLQFVLLTGTVALSGADFGYSRREQHNWARRYKECGGKFQSPIAISSTSVPFPLPAIETFGYHDPLPRPLLIKNNGHTVAVSLANKNRVPCISGAVFNKNDRYEVDHLHFHWGARNDRGSEHVLNHVRFPLEMHIVHRKKAYANFSDALNHKDGLAVIAVFFQLREEDNEKLGPLIRNLGAVKWQGEKISSNVSLSLSSLMPVNADRYYAYKGSLTTPPCSEVVTWLVLPTPVPISFRQMSKFRDLSNGETALVDNYRQLQHPRYRTVYLRRTDQALIEKYNGTFLDVGTLKWYEEWDRTNLALD